MRSVTDAFEQGWSAVKLYFMIGLPTETDEDVLGIADLAEEGARMLFLPCRRRSARRGCASRSARPYSCRRILRPSSGAAQLDSETVIRRQQLLRGGAAAGQGRGFQVSCARS